MKALIAKWDSCSDDNHYTLFVIPNSLKRKDDIFWLIDRVGDPFSSKYKIFDYDDRFEYGIESQEQIKAVYIGDDDDDEDLELVDEVKECDFTKVDLKRLYTFC